MGIVIYWDVISKKGGKFSSRFQKQKRGLEMKNKSKSVSLRNGAPQRLVKVIAECNVSYNSFIGEFVPQLGYSKK